MPELKPFHKAIALLSRREHSELELRRKLARFEFDEVELEQAISDVIAAGYLSDERFAESYVRMRARRGYGPLRIEMELQERGVSAELIAEFVQADSDKWEQRAFEVFAKKYPQGLANEHQQRMKQLKFMQYRGFAAYSYQSMECPEPEPGLGLE